MGAILNHQSWNVCFLLLDQAFEFVLQTFCPPGKGDQQIKVIPKTNLIADNKTYLLEIKKAHIWKEEA